MKNFLIALFGVIILSQGTIPVGNGVPRAYNFTIMCVDGYKFITTSFGYSAISTLQIYDPGKDSNASGQHASQPATCKDK